VAGRGERKSPEGKALPYQTMACLRSGDGWVESRVECGSLGEVLLALKLARECPSPRWTKGWGGGDAPMGQPGRLSGGLSKRVSQRPAKMNGGGGCEGQR
jgi:hypothetical protein